jgi:DNA-binding response OmpR family regulator
MNEFVQDLKIYAKGMKILVVEDDLELNSLLSQTLSMFFRVVDSVYNGQEALEIYKANHHDVIISDINMPIMDGITFASKIKNIEPTQSIIMLSAHTDAQYFIKLIEIGVSAFSPKPYNPDSFMMILTRETENVSMRKEYERIKLKELKEQLKIDLKTSSNNNTTNNITTRLVNKLQSDVTILKENVDKIKNQNTQSSKLLEEFKTDKETWDVLKFEIDNIIYLNNDLEDSIDIMLFSGINDELIEEISEILHRYFNIFSNVKLFIDIARAFKDLSEFLSDIKVDSLDNQEYESLMNLEYILEDTKNFINDVFIEQKEISHKYFENSIISNVKQIKTVFGLENGNDVDFF